ncbi:putative regulatory protein, FmdB family [Bowdeniella nasicola]|uniref:Putative regulatory protein, FmdB family n=1 Tax=Bowdeniella nasicola TaxID=208480 RepID=A0A1H3ZCH3_9ACTO|nr:MULTISPECIES: FmdB family zinc ribbon protein [Bowdeniella]SEA21499.1 putative regulatory protein, FmdB family [Bowdeniella nasicola]
MPTYAYRCTNCAHEFEVHQSFSEDSLKTCEGCGGRLRKLFQPGAVMFKGSGFYRTDSRNSGSSSVSSSKPAKPSTSSKPSSGGGSSAGGR